MWPIIGRRYFKHIFLNENYYIVIFKFENYYIFWSSVLIFKFLKKMFLHRDICAVYVLIITLYVVYPWNVIQPATKQSITMQHAWRLGNTNDLMEKRRNSCALAMELGLFSFKPLIQYIPRNMHTVFALLCFVVVLHWLIYPYPPGLLRWHCGNLTIAPVPAKQPWWIWINTSCEIIMNDYITTTKQSTTKPCAYLLGYTVKSLR